MRVRFDSGSVSQMATRSGDPRWLRQRRHDAFSRFEVMAWPDQALEEWRHTDIRLFNLIDFHAIPPKNETHRSLDAVPAAITERAIGDVGDRLGLSIQIDADVVFHRVSPRLTEQGVVFKPLSRGAKDFPNKVKAVLGRAGVSDHEAKFALLNAAFSNGGAFLYVPRGVTLEKPIQSVRWLSRAHASMFPRVVIVADEGASVTYIDHYAGEELGGPGLCVASVEIHAHPESNVSYLAVQDWPQTVWHFGSQRAVVERDATVRSLQATLGGRLSRSVVESVLDGPGAASEMLGVYFGDGEQHIDHRTLQCHQAPSTTSEVYFKGALKGSSRAIYSGLVDLEKDAVRADAQQTNRNLLLSHGASAAPTPFLEIKTSEVARATHAVSVGRPEADVLFYLRSRGLDDRAAERVYVQGFFQEILDRVRLPEIRETLEAAVQAELELEE